MSRRCEADVKRACSRDDGIELLDPVRTKIADFDPTSRARRHGDPVAEPATVAREPSKAETLRLELPMREAEPHDLICEPGRTNISLPIGDALGLPLRAALGLRSHVSEEVVSGVPTASVPT
jgi:hypothetical protein